MEDLAIERLKQLLSWLPPHELDIAVTGCLGRFSSAAEYAERTLFREFEDEWPWLLEHLNFEATAAAWIEEGRIAILEDPSDGYMSAGVFVLRGSW